MRCLLLLLFLMAGFAACSQFDRNLSLEATLSYNITLQGFATNDAGGGVRMNAALFARKKLQLLAEAGSDIFWGDKLLVLDSAGKTTRNAQVHTLRLGGRYFLAPRLALSASYGPSWHAIRAFGHTLDGSLGISCTYFAGKNRRTITRFSYTAIQGTNPGMRYIAMAIGRRFL